MPKEVNIDIGGGKRADYFVSRAVVEKHWLFIVLDPSEFRCPYINIYSNLQLIRWGASERGNWELPFIDYSVDEANMNFISDFMKWTEGGQAYDSIIESLKRILKPTGVVCVREPEGTIRYLAEKFEEHGFQIIKPVPLEEDVSVTSVYLRKTGKGEIDSTYFPMEFKARLNRG